MAKSFKQPLLIGLLALAPLFTACERSADISGVTELPVPTVAAARQKTARVVTRQTVSTSGVVYSQWISGGKSTTLTIGKYELFVPKGAVKKPTLFRMQVLSGDVIGVSLNAWDNSFQPVTQFQAPLRLTLPYDDADFSQFENPSKLLLANIVSDTDTSILELVSPSIDPIHQTITGNITHFSIWSLAVSLSKELSPGID
jgi:hypothetical protein